ncbi:hypothetical protein MSAN_02294200 [Mycena sanguinolenta]|uniref:Uncharacterized protein n=1 Tax=Mycena sanguinolenta TaxID=230812 RepID=A0A8H6X9U0_9AGAR|nr:hypothetical protein MSAN_02294200 [Mycena sanguinolenta]
MSDSAAQHDDRDRYRVVYLGSSHRMDRCGFPELQVGAVSDLAVFNPDFFKKNVERLWVEIGGNLTSTTVLTFLAVGASLSELQLLRCGSLDPFPFPIDSLGALRRLGLPAEFLANMGGAALPGGVTHLDLYTVPSMGIPGPLRSVLSAATHLTHLSLKSPVQDFVATLPHLMCIVYFFPSPLDATHTDPRVVGLVLGWCPESSWLAQVRSGEDRWREAERRIDRQKQLPAPYAYFSQSDEQSVGIKDPSGFDGDGDDGDD